MPNVSHYYGSQYKGIMINNSLDLVNYLLEEANIAKGIDRLEEALSKLK